MRAVLALLACLLSGGALAQPVPMFMPTKAAGGGGGYTGPGNIATFDHWCGMRAYSAATAASHMQVGVLYSVSGGVTQAINLLSSGDMDTTTANAFQVAHADAAWQYVTDQATGNTTACTGNDPGVQYTSNAYGGKAGIKFLGTTVTGLQLPAMGLTTPMTYETVTYQTVVNASEAYIVQENGAPYPLIRYGSTSGSIYCGSYIGGYSTINFTGLNTTSLAHFVGGIYNGASSLCQVDSGTATGTMVAAGTGVSGFVYAGGWNAGTQELTGYGMEWGWVASALSTTVLNNLYTNAKAYYGLP